MKYILLTLAFSVIFLWGFLHLQSENAELRHLLSKPTETINNSTIGNLRRDIAKNKDKIKGNTGEIMKLTSSTVELMGEVFNYQKYTN